MKRLLTIPLLVSMVLGLIPIGLGISQTRSQLDSLRECVEDLILKGQTKEAVKLAEDALPIAEQEYGRDHPGYADWLSRLAGVYQLLGRYSESILLDAIRISKIHHTDRFLFYADLCVTLAKGYYKTGRYKEAEVFYLEALGIWAKQKTPRDSRYIDALYSLGVLYSQLGRYAQAEALTLKALKVAEEAPNRDRDTLAYINCLKSHALACYRMGKHAEALVDIIKTIIEYDFLNSQEAGVDRGQMLWDEAMVFITLDEIEKANMLRVNIGKQGDPSNLMTVSRLEAARRLVHESIELRRRQFGPNHPDYARGLYVLADINRREGNYSAADSLCTQAIQIIKGTLGERNALYAQLLFESAELSWQTGNYTKAMTFYLNGLDSRATQLNEFFEWMSEADRAAFHSTVVGEFERFDSFAFRYTQGNPSVLGAQLNNRLASKGLLLSTTSRVNRLIRNSGDSLLIRQFNSWLSTKESLARAYTLTRRELAQREINLDSLEQSAKDMEKELSLRSEPFKKVYEKKPITWQELQSVLNPSKAAVEIIRFRLYDKRWTDSVYYAALIVTPQTKDHPELVVLENGNELEGASLGEYREIIEDQKPRVQVGGVKVTEAHIKKVLSGLYRQYWQKIQAKLKGIKRVYLSLDGVYNQINLLTLFNSETGRYLLEDLDIQIVTNTKDLVSYADTPKREVKNIAELFGYPNYALGTERHELLAASYQRERDVPIYGRTADSLDRYMLTDLPGTKKEVETIEGILKSRGWETRTHLGDDALEEAVKAVSSPRVLVISTHGYFLEDVQRAKEEGMLLGMQAERVIENPLLRSGLMLAGAQRTLSNDSSARSLKADNGILTAYEAMNLDLDNTELVVLSACETGLGEVKNGEGVYGLQRAFQVAGARTIIMSLWKVGDEATRELMTAFFNNWLSGMTKQEAFNKAQLQLKTKYPEPYYWGAFVMVGE